MCYYDATKYIGVKMTQTTDFFCFPTFKSIKCENSVLIHYNILTPQMERVDSENWLFESKLNVTRFSFCVVLDKKTLEKMTTFIYRTHLKKE